MSGQDAASSSREVEEVSNADVIFAYRDTQKKELQLLVDKQAEELRAFMSKQSMDFCSFCDKLAEKTSKRMRSAEPSKDDTAKEAQGAGSNDDDSNSRKKQRSSVIICIDDDEDKEPDVVPEVKLEPIEAEVAPKAVEAEVAPKAVEAEVAAKAVEAEVAPKAVEAEVAPKAVEAVVAPKAVEPVVVPKAVEAVVAASAIEPVVVPKAIALEVAMPDTESEEDQPEAGEDASEPEADKEAEKPKGKRTSEDILQDSMYLVGSELRVDLERYLNREAWETLKRAKAHVMKLPGHVQGVKCPDVKNYIPGPKDSDHSSTYSGFMQGKIFVFPLDELWGLRVMKAFDDVIKYVNDRRPKAKRSTDGSKAGQSQGGSAKGKKNNR